MKKKLLALILCISMVAVLLAGCGGGSKDSGSADGGSEGANIKIGIIYIGDENEGYTASHMNGIHDAIKELGLSEDDLIEKTNIPEDESAYDAAVDLAEQGCTIIFGTSFGHEDFLIQAASEYPEITFCHATGYQAASSGLENMHNYFDGIYQARYVSGVVAGLKLQDMINNGELTADKCKIGYIGAFPFAEVISGFTAFYLGARSIVPEATMEVQYTNSWADSSLEAETARALVSDGCVLISQHADTTGAPSECEAMGVPCVGYNISMLSVAPNSALTSPTNYWHVYYKMAIEAAMSGDKLPTGWAGGYEVDAVGITELGDSCAPGTQEKVDETIAALKDGSLHVFDITTFTVDGKQLEDSDYVYDGYFHESELAAAPSFDFIIDGITAD